MTEDDPSTGAPAPDPTSPAPADAPTPLGQPIEDVVAYFHEMEADAPKGPAAPPRRRRSSSSSSSSKRGSSKRDSSKKRSSTSGSSPTSSSGRDRTANALATDPGSGTTPVAAASATAAVGTTSDRSDRSGTTGGTSSSGGAAPSGDAVPSSRSSSSSGSRSSRGGPAADALVLGIAAVAALGAVLAGGHPTVVPVFDAVLRGAFAFIITVATAQARRWSWIVMAGVAAGASRDLLSGVPAWAALGLTCAAIVFEFRPRWVGALVGLLATTALLRLDPIGPHGFTALLAGLAVLPVLGSAYRRQHRATRARLRGAAYALAALVVLPVIGLGVAALIGAPKVSSGVAEARAGVASAKTGDDAGTTAHLTTAVSKLDAASGALGSWYAAPARFVPIVSYHAEALAQMSATGHDLAVTASDTATQANYRSIDVRDGRIDTDRIAALGPPLLAVRVALDRAQAQTDAIETDWLAAPLRDKFDDLHREVAETKDETVTAIDAVAVAPGMLGADGPRRYFVAFTTPAETRGLGGFMGNFAELTADHGKLELTRTGRSSDLAPKPGDPPRTLDAPEDYLTRYGPLRPEKEVRDATFSPDFPSVAQALESIYPQTDGGRPVDGVIAIDPYTLAEMLKITGPVQVEGMSEPLTATNAADYLLRGQYLTFDPTDQNQERIDVLEKASRATFDAFIHAKSLRPSQLAAVLGPMVQQRRLLASSTHPAEQALITRIGMDGAFPAHDDGDFFSVVTQNAGNNKMDVYLQRDIDYRVTYNPGTGNVEATATVTLHNDGPSSGLPDYVIGNRGDIGQPKGTNYVWFNFYSPHLLESATLDGQPMAIGAQREFGLQVYDTRVAVPSGGDARIELHLKGNIRPASTYAVSWFQQPTVQTDHVRVTLQPVHPWAVAPGPSTTADGQKALVAADPLTDDTIRIDLTNPDVSPG